jgi:hypothetical protein
LYVLKNALMEFIIMAVFAGLALEDATTALKYASLVVV